MQPTEGRDRLGSVAPAVVQRLSLAESEYRQLAKASLSII